MPFLKSISRWFRRPKDPSGYLYYVKLKTPKGVFYKIGYTSKPSLIERMTFNQCGDEKLIERELLFVFRKDAWDIEQMLLEHFDKQRAFGKFSNDENFPLAGRGQSELFRHDILGLDYELYILSEEEKIALKKEDEDSAGGCLLTIIGLALAPFTLGLSLIFVFGGFSEIFKGKEKSLPRPKKPSHPPKIKALIESLLNNRQTNN